MNSKPEKMASKIFVKEEPLGLKLICLLIDTTGMSSELGITKSTHFRL